MTQSRYADSPAYQTLDGSLIRELMHPRVHSNVAQSLAEATIPAGGHTLMHRHHRSEEIYHVTAGSGWMWLVDQWLRIERGDTVCIAPDSAHFVRADDDHDLVILCCCSPPYDHADTELLAAAATCDEPPTI